MLMSNKVWDVMKWIGITLCPALSTFVRAICLAWGLPYAEPICATIDAFGVFLAAILVVSAVSYAKSNKLD